MARGDPGRFGIQRVIERRLRNWEIQRDQKPQRSPSTRPAVHPYLALSRQVGCGATDVAGLLAAKLNWTVYDKEILEHMAADDEVRRRMYRLMDEQQENWFDEILRPLALGGETLRNDYFRQLRIAVGAIAMHESAIFLGRGAGLLLPTECGLHVRLVAPRAMRLAAYAKRAGLSRGQAEEVVDRIDADRRKFLETHFGPDPWSEEKFDLVLNTARFAPAQLADVMVGALAAKLPSAASAR